ncbi:eukaryotic translation initiation factor 3 subunit A-like [Apostichopus japonicus]|uniref:eukaryotic translation initiation factor 3 subunit A-like n=1 Tax=Stichopus japonicus TaxID=307972 RepID=UPI003AB719DA
MPTYFQRPENALKRANEFIDVGKKEPALEVLCDVIKSKRHRTWQKIHEPIMEKYLGLCVELRKSHVAKEGLYQYKIISQQVNVKSLEDVVRKYLQLAEAKTESARKESAQTVDDIDDLDNVNTPEDLLLSAVSGEDVQARTDRVVLIPWVKFLWESYRQCLDLLRNNNRLEGLYQDVAHGAFRFCQKYQRKTEFRKLCDNLRNHLALIQKHQNQPLSINLNSPESQQVHLDTRLFQLETAIHMELWQEAYKAVEDIHNLMEISKKTPKAQLMATYYTKLGLVFWKSGNRLFHACALHRLLQLSREHRKNLSTEEMQRMASRVLLATLSVPICPPRNDIGDMLDMGNTAVDNERKLAKMLGLQTPPNRAQLANDLIKYNVVPHVLPELRELFNWLEIEFHPLHLCSRVSDVLSFLEASDPDLAQYVPALQTNTLVRLLKQVAQMYDTISVSRIMELVPFYSPYQIEKTIVESARNGAVQIRLDHSQQMLSFGGELSVSQTGDQQDDGPMVQEMPSEQIRQQLTQMSKALHHALQLIRPAQLLEEKKNQKQQIIQSYRRSAVKDHQRILQRKQIIEDRKERLESITVQREREEQDQLEEQQRVQREAEQLRLSREAEDRARRKRQEELEEIQRKHAKERIKTLKQSSVAPKMFSKYTEEELEKLDADEIMAKHVEQLEAEKKELQARLKSQEKKIDYFCRAQRVEEIPLLEKQYEEEAMTSKELWEEMESERIEMAQKEREHALAIRDRLKRMTKDKNEFLNMLKETRSNIYNDKLNTFNEMIKEARGKRLMERKQKRKNDRRLKWVTEKEEAEQQRRDEEAKREREMKQKKEEEEYQERLQKLKEQEEKQAAKLREIDERMEREKTQGDAPFRRRDEGSDSWRRDENRSAPERPADSDQAGNRPWRPRFREEGGRGGGFREEGGRGGGFREEGGRGGGFREEGGRGGGFREEGGRAGAWRSRYPDGEGPQRGDRDDGWRRDGPPRDGPPRDGPPRDGPPRDGPPRDGPPRDGPPRDDWRRDRPPREVGRGPIEGRGEPRREFDRPPRDLERPPRDLERPPRDLERPPRDLERPPRDLERPPRDLERPPRDLERPPRDLERPQREVTRPSRDDQPPRDGPPHDKVEQRPPPGPEDAAPAKDEKREVPSGGDSAGQEPVRRGEPPVREPAATPVGKMPYDIRKDEPDFGREWEARRRARDRDLQENGARRAYRDDSRKEDHVGGSGRDRDIKRDDRDPSRQGDRGFSRDRDIRRDGWGRGGDDRGPPLERSGWRDESRQDGGGAWQRGYRDGPRGPPRDAWRSDRGGRDDRGPRRYDGDDRGPRRDDRDDRGPRRDDRDDRGPRRDDRDDRGPWRRGDGGGGKPPGQDDGGWKEREPPKKEIPRRRDPEDDGAKTVRKSQPKETDDDGWTTVRR